MAKIRKCPYCKSKKGFKYTYSITGADREMDFDSEKEFGKRYEIYLDNAH